MSDNVVVESGPNPVMIQQISVNGGRADWVGLHNWPSGIDVQQYQVGETVLGVQIKPASSSLAQPGFTEFRDPTVLPAHTVAVVMLVMRIHSLPLQIAHVDINYTANGQQGVLDVPQNVAAQT